MPNQLHDTMKRVYEALDISEQKLAESLGLKLSTIINWQKNGISKIGINKLNQTFGLDMQWILTGQGEPFIKKLTKKSKLKSTSASGKKPKLTAKEAYLEFLQRDDGMLVLQEVGDKEPLVTICFADKIKEMLGQENLQMIGQHMIQAAIATFMQKQMNQYHAHVFDEKPKRFS